MRQLSYLFFIYFIFLFSIVYCKNENYEGNALYQITVNEIDQIKLVDELGTRFDGDVWSQALPGRFGRILIPARYKKEFEFELKRNNVEFSKESDNIKELIDLEEQVLALRPKEPYNVTRTVPLPLNNVYTYEEIDAYIEDIAKAYPSTVTLVNAGESFEGRDIKYLKISTTNFEDNSKPVIFIQSLLHCREWITQAATLYAIQKLVTDVTDSDLLEDIDWIILPIANPDGFVYTHEVGRFWRKNRATGYMVDDICVGVDLNRNFDFNWSEASSNIVCLDTFHGRSPFSEPETSIIREIFIEHKSRMQLFLDIHSFGSMVLYGYGNGVLPQNGLWLHLVGVMMAERIDQVKETWNPNYIVGNVAMILYEASGSAMDYAQSIGVPYSYTFELPGRRYGIGALGFLVDPDFIEQAGYETWEGIKIAARYIRANYKESVQTNHV